MWSLWRCVSTSTVSWFAWTPTAAARISTPRPQSNRKVTAARPHERGRSGTERIDERAAGAEQGDLDHGDGFVIPTAILQPRRLRP